jgi:hypothetical protein
VRGQGRLSDVRTLFTTILVVIAAGLAYFIALGLMHR